MGTARARQSRRRHGSPLARPYSQLCLQAPGSRVCHPEPAPGWDAARGIAHPGKIPCDKEQAPAHFHPRSQNDPEPARGRFPSQQTPKKPAPGETRHRAEANRLRQAAKSSRCLPSQHRRYQTPGQTTRKPPMQMLAGEGSAVSLLRHAGKHGGDGEMAGHKMDVPARLSGLPGGKTGFFGAANAFQEAEGAAGVKQTPPCPACLSAAAWAAVSCAWPGPGGRRRGGPRFGSRLGHHRRCSRVFRLCSYHPTAKVSSAPCRCRLGFQGKQLLQHKAGATPRDPVAGTRQPAPPRCRIWLGQEEQGRGDSPSPFLYLLAGIKSALPPVYSPAAEGAAGFGPPPLLPREGRRVLQRGEDDGGPRARLLLGKTPTSYRNRVLNTPAVHPRVTPAWCRTFMAFTTGLGN